MLDLKARFGKRYKIFHDPSWDAETSEQRTLFRRTGGEAWYYELRGPSAVISPRDKDTVSVLWLGRGSKALLATALHVKPLDGGMLYVLANNALESVLNDVKAYRRRQVSEAEKDRLRAMSAKYRFKRVRGGA